MEQNEHQSISSAKKEFKLSTPVAIIIAAVLIVGGIFASKLPIFQKSNAGAPVAQPDTSTPQGLAQVIFNTKSKITVPAVTASDHVQGDLSTAKVVIIEYSDLECPFCQRFHGVMQQIMTQYSGQVAWVYRHFPLTTIHPDALPDAIASECANEQGGNTTFWNFADTMFATQDVNETQGERISNAVKTLGLNPTTFTACQSNPATMAIVQKDIDQGTALGINGTPTSYIIAGNDQYTVDGAFPIEAMTIVLDKLTK